MPYDSGNKRFQLDTSDAPPRISESDWDDMKDIILKRYENHTLEEIMTYMEKHHDFKATKRQYIHRIGEKWGIKKYKQLSGGGDPSSGWKRRRSPSEDHRDQSLSEGGRKIPKSDASLLLTPDANLSCPYRKRNPIKFNVRDYQSCAVQSFPDISQLKRHIKNFHKHPLLSAFACPRCKADLKSKEKLEAHLAVPNELICKPQESAISTDPEDGISSRVEDMLNGRKANTKIDTWDVLWHTLFPDDDIYSSPAHGFTPPREHFELKKYIIDHISFFVQDLLSEIPDTFNATDLDKEKLETKLKGSIIDCIESFEAGEPISRGRERRRRRHRGGDGIGSSRRSGSRDPEPGNSSRSRTKALDSTLSTEEKEKTMRYQPSRADSLSEDEWVQAKRLNLPRDDDPSPFQQGWARQLSSTTSMSPPRGISPSGYAQGSAYHQYPFTRYEPRPGSPTGPVTLPPIQSLSGMPPPLPHPLTSILSSGPTSQTGSSGGLMRPPAFDSHWAPGKIPEPAVEKPPIQDDPVQAMHDIFHRGEEETNR